VSFVGDELRGHTQYKPGDISTISALVSRSVLVEVVEHVDLLESILGNTWLYINWHFITKHLTTEQREAFADAVDAWSEAMNPEEPNPVADRWWR